MTADYNRLRENCYHANMALNKLGLVVYTFGNVSIADHQNGIFAIKPSGVPYEDLKPEDIVVVDMEGKVICGNKRPSSDTNTHAYLYKKWPKMGSIVHTHSTYAVAWAQAQMDVPIFGTTHADHLTVDVPCAPPMEDALIKGDYEKNTGKQIISHFENKNLNYQEVEMILVGNHGPFTWGKTADKALYNSKILEEISKMAFLTKQINPNVSRLKDSLINKHFERKHGDNSYYGQE